MIRESDRAAIITNLLVPSGRPAVSLAGLFVQAAGRVTIATGQRSTAGKAGPAQFFNRWIFPPAFIAASHPVIGRLLRRTCFFEGATHGV